MILQYDGSFEGFLSLVYEVFYKKYKPTKLEGFIAPDNTVIGSTTFYKMNRYCTTSKCITLKN